MEYAVKRGRLYDGGNERVRYRLEYPTGLGREGINSFCGKVAENCENYCKEELYTQARESGQKYLYELDILVTHSDERAVSLLVRARLSAGRQLICQRIRTVSWDVRTQLMIPPRMLARKYGERGRKIPKGAAVFLCEGRLESVDRADDDIFRRKK